MKRTYELFYEGADAGGGSGGGGGAAVAAPAGGGSSGGSLLSGGGSSAQAGGGSQGGAAVLNGSGGAASGGQNGGAAANGAGTQSPWFANLYDATGKVDASKWENAPAHIKPYKDTFARYKNVDELFGGVANAFQLAGKKGLQPLPADAPAEAKAERLALMRSLNNTPEKPEGYGITKPEGMADDQWNGDYVKGITEIAHKHGISPDAMKELVAFDGKFATDLRTKSETAVAAARAGEVAKIKEAFGADADAQMDLARRAARSAGLDPNDAGVFSNAATVIAFAKLGSMMSEDRLVSGQTAGVGQGAAMDDMAKARDIATNKANPMHEAYHNPEHPNHANVVNLVGEMHKRHHARQKKA